MIFLLLRDVMREKQPPLEVLIHDDLESCPYLDGRTARLPMRYPLRMLSPRELDQRLAAGDRRQGMMLYRTNCPHCRECQPIRVEVERFVPSRTQRRILQRGDQQFELEVAAPQVDPLRVQLYNQHKRHRDLDSGEMPIDEEGYRSFLVDTCCDTLELRYWMNGRLAAVAVADRGQDSLSAVYCYFDPCYSRSSPGTYSVLKHIELCREWGLRYLYLGYYINEPCVMTYKGTFRPHQRLIAGRWQTSE